MVPDEKYDLQITYARQLSGEVRVNVGGRGMVVGGEGPAWPGMKSVWGCPAYTYINEPGISIMIGHLKC